MTDFADRSHRDLVLSAADELEAMLATLSRLDISDFENSRRRQRDEQDALAKTLTTRRDAPAVITGNPYRGTTFAMLGFRSASTTGFTGAAQNWIAQVRKKTQTWEAHR